MDILHYLCIISGYKILFSIFCRIGWLTLVTLFAYFAFSISIGQVYRFIEDPFIYTVETQEISNVDWSYRMPAYTVCSDFVNNSFIDQYYKRSKNVTFIDKDSKVYKDYYRYMEAIGSLNAGNIDSLDQFENSEWFKDLSGEEIFEIAIDVAVNV